MMYLETSQLLQLAVALIGATAVLVISHSAPLKVSVGTLLVLIPFQPVETTYGSANVIMTFTLAGALVLARRLQYAPMMGALLAVIFTQLITMSQLPSALYVLHGLQFIFLVSGLLVFVLAYNLARDVEPRTVINIFLCSNVIAIVYCLVQFAIGPGEKFELFGMSEFSMHRNRGGGDPRLTGPFGSPTTTSGYFMTMLVVLTYEIMHARHRRRLGLVVLATLNLAMLMATANRGSFLVLVASLLGFLYLFRSQLGVARVAQILVASVVFIAAVGATLSTYTEFGRVLDRLETNTHFEGGVPDTRQRLWAEATQAIAQKPWLGYGPRLVNPNESLRRGGAHPQQLVLEYPHNLYLYLLLTGGIVGTTAMLFFLFGVTWRIFRTSRFLPHNGSYEKGLLLVGFLVLGGVFVDEIKIEFLRHSSIDYAHFVFALFGAFLAIADRLRMQHALTTDEHVTLTRGRTLDRGAAPLPTVSRQLRS